MKKAISLLIFLFALSLSAQETQKSYPWIIKIDAPQLFDITTFPVIQLSLERKVSTAFSVIAEGGIQLYEQRESKPDTLIYSARGFKVKLEARCYLMRLLYPDRFKIMHRAFVGIQPFYRENRYTTQMTYNKKDPVTDSIIYVLPRLKDYFGYKNQSYGVNLTLGFQKPVGKRFVFEPSIAIGYMNRKVTNIDRVFDPKTNESDSNHDIFGFEDRRLSESSGDVVNFSLHFRVGYKF